MYTKLNILKAYFRNRKVSFYREMENPYTGVLALFLPTVCFAHDSVISVEIDEERELTAKVN